VVLVTSPNSHRTINTIAIVYNINSSFQLALFTTGWCESHQPRRSLLGQGAILSLTHWRDCWKPSFNPSNAF
jgi:hypothetical protein